MLPAFLDSTYKRYKNDTSAFIRWLVENAKKCGYTPARGPAANVGKSEEPAKAPRLKGKARKQAKAATTASAPTSQKEPKKEAYLVSKYILGLFHELNIPRAVGH